MSEIMSFWAYMYKFYTGLILGISVWIRRSNAFD